MSFSQTPLGQDRRLDHHAFLKKGGVFHNHPQSATTSPPRRVASLNTIPLSYAYGAPTSANTGTHPASPRLRRNTSGSQEASNKDETAEDESEELSQYAQLKQRNALLANRPGSSLGPGVITTPPQPTGTNLKDTSVNIASAFYQAVSTHTTMSSTWTANSRQHVPRSTSVEYEAEARNSSHRRLAVPPNRAGGKVAYGVKPLSRTGSIREVDENERSADSSRGRAKSPFDTLTDLTKKAIAPATTFLMRQRSVEPDPRPAARQATDATLVTQDNGESYDYAEEEAEFQTAQKPPSKRTNISAINKRGRISEDNMAYRPSMSDFEETSEEDDDDGKKRSRKKKSKKKEFGGPLNTLPTTTYDKRKKRKGRSGKGGDQGDDGEGSDGQYSDHQSVKSVSMQRQASVSRSSVPPRSRSSVPPEPTSFETSGTTDPSNDMEQGLGSIAEEEEEVSTHSNNSARPASSPRMSREPRFSIGAVLGKMVNVVYRVGHGFAVFIFRLLAIVTLLVGRILGTVVDVLVRPMQIFSQPGQSGPVGKYILVALSLCALWYALHHPSLMNISTNFKSRTPYQPPDVPAETVEEFSARLMQLETFIKDLQLDRERERSKLDQDLQQKQREVLARIGQFEGRIDKELVRAQNIAENSGNVASKGLEALSKEVRVLRSQTEEILKRPAGNGNDEEARAKLQAFETRMSGVEGGVKEALELGQTALKAGSAAAGVAAPSWWNKISTGAGAKTSDGQDLISIIGNMVESMISRHAKDDLALVDYALNSGGASVIPSLTSPTEEVRPKYFFGLLSGAPYFARSPVTAIHHERTSGYCWRFPGKKGQIGIKLAAPVYISNVTIDHVARELAIDIRLAPRKLEVWGLVEGKENTEKMKGYMLKKEKGRREAAERGEVLQDEPPYPETLPRNTPFVRIASFEYDINAPNFIQTFPVFEDIRELSVDFGIVVFMVNDNWGHEMSTCLYRARVHGERLEDPPLPDAESS